LTDQFKPLFSDGGFSLCNGWQRFKEDCIYLVIKTKEKILKTRIYEGPGMSEVAIAEKIAHQIGYSSERASILARTALLLLLGF